jgi:hypothetical protein
MILFKQLTGSNVDWRVYHEELGNDKRLCLNDDSDVANDDSAFNDTSPSSTVFTVGGSTSTNPSADMIAYCFAEKTGYSKIGGYTGNGNADGTFVHTGMRPKFLLLKERNASSSWYIFNGAVNTSNPTHLFLKPNGTDAEGGSGSAYLDFLSNGFKWRANSGALNGSGDNYVYMAFGQSAVGSNNIPCVAR